MTRLSSLIVLSAAALALAAPAFAKMIRRRTLQDRNRKKQPDLKF
jgi:hypothetical protein